MDIQLKKRKYGTPRQWTVAGIVLAVVVLAGMFFYANRGTVVRIDTRMVAVDSVRKGEFKDYVRVVGQVQPISSQQLSPEEGGIVETKFVEEGASVTAGQPILRLRNSNLDLEILNAEANLAEKQNFLRNTQVTMEQEKLSLRKEKLQLDLDVERKRRKSVQYASLYAERLVSEEEYLQAAEDYEFAVKERDLVMERQRQDSIYRSIQVQQMEESLANIRKNLVLQRQRIGNLDIKSPVDGQLGLLNVEIGQSVGSGTQIGQVSVLSDFKIEALIDEHYIDRVRAGLDASFERQDRQFDLRVRKVYPEVRDKQFKTDFVFAGERPDNIRAGQTYYINLQLGQPADAVLIPRGAFYQNTGGQWIYVLTPDGGRAVRRNIRIGRQNPLYYEVLDGLQPGEQVVVSAYDQYGEAEELVIQE